MEWNIKEFIINLVEEDILIVRQKDAVSRLTKEGAVECVEKIIELCKIDDRPKVMITYVASLYINKEVLKVFIDNPIPENVCANGMISFSFLAKNMASIILKMRTRFVKNDVPTKIFSTEEAALEWGRSFLSPKS